MRTAFIQFVVVATLMGTGCTQPEEVTAEEHLGIVWEGQVLLEGRPFMLSVMDVDQQSSKERVLSISGDELVISFHSAGRPNQPTVAGSEITFGGHTFGVTSTKGSFVINGTPISLTPTPRTVHLFSNGAYRGTHSY